MYPANPPRLPPPVVVLAANHLSRLPMQPRGRSTLASPLLCGYRMVCPVLHEAPLLRLMPHGGPRSLEVCCLLSPCSSRGDRGTNGSNDLARNRGTHLRLCWRRSFLGGPPVGEQHAGERRPSLRRWSECGSESVQRELAEVVRERVSEVECESEPSESRRSRSSAFSAVTCDPLPSAFVNRKSALPMLPTRRADF